MNWYFHHLECLKRNCFSGYIKGFWYWQQIRRKMFWQSITILIFVAGTVKGTRVKGSLVHFIIYVLVFIIFQSDLLVIKITARGKERSNSIAWAVSLDLGHTLTCFGSIFVNIELKNQTVKRFKWCGVLKSISTTILLTSHTSPPKFYRKDSLL